MLMLRAINAFIQQIKYHSFPLLTLPEVKRKKIEDEVPNLRFKKSNSLSFKIFFKESEPLREQRQK